MKKKVSIILLSIILIMSLLGLEPTMGATTTLSATNKTVNSGEEISISISSSISLTGWTISVSNDGGCTFVSASGGEVNGKSVFGTSSNGTKSLATYKFKAPTVSKDTTYTIKFSGTNMCDVNTDEVLDDTCTATIVVKAKTQTGTDTTGGGSENTSNGSTPTTQKASLSALSVNGTKKSVSSKMQVTVEEKKTISIKPTTSNAESCTITNKKTGDKYTIYSGNEKSIKLEQGTNTLVIKLASGAEYTLTVYNIEKQEEVKPNVIEEKPKEEVKVLLKSLSVKGVKSEEDKINLSFTPEFSAEVYEYKILLDETLEDITKLEIEAKASQDDFTVEITGNEELKEGENVVTIIVKSKDGKTTTTYKILVTKEAKVVPIVAPTVEVEQEVIKPLWNRTQQILITVFTSIIALMGIAYAVIEYRYKKEPEVEIPYSGTTLEEDMNKEVEDDKIGEIPFAKVGFEKENDNKVDLLKEEKEEEAAEEEKTKEKPKRGKHF